MNEYPELPPQPQRNSSLWFWWGLLFLAVGAFVYLKVRPIEPAPNSGPNFPGVGVTLSTVRFEPLTGEPPPIDKPDLAGKVAVINFWGPWCHFCREEMPHLLAMQKRLAQREDFRLVLVSNNGPDEDVDQLRVDTAEYLSTLGEQPPTWYDPHFQSLSALAREAGLPRIGFPITAVLDRQGVLRGLWIGFGPGDAESLERLVGELLE